MSWMPSFIKNFSEFTFAQPHWLWLLVIPTILLFLKGNIGGAPAIFYSSTSIFRSIGRPRSASPWRISKILPILTLALAIVALARPQLSNSYTQIEASGIDIMLALDVSRSMLAEDYQTQNGERANRIDSVKEITQHFIEARPGDRIGMLAFAGRPYLVSPLTLDHDWLIQNLDRIRIGLVEDGTAIGSAIASAANRLKNSKAKSRIIVLLSDGGNNAGRISPTTAAEAAAALGIKIYTIGVGSQGPAPYPVTDGFGRRVYRTLEADLDEKTLSQIAKTAGGRYYAAKTTQLLKDIYNEIDRFEKSKVSVNKYRQYRDLFMWFVSGSIFLLTLYLILLETIWRKLP